MLDVLGNVMVGILLLFLFIFFRILLLNVVRNYFSGVFLVNLMLGKLFFLLDVFGNFFFGFLLVVFLFVVWNVVIYFQSNCMEMLKQKQGLVEYCIEIVVKFGIEKLYIYSYLVFIIVVVVVGGLCLLVVLCVLVVFVVRRCGNEKDSVVVFEDGNFGLFCGIFFELFFNVSMIIQYFFQFLIFLEFIFVYLL